jgi:rhodanese-related sulfurtransferase
LPPQRPAAPSVPRPHTELARRAYLGPEDTAAVDATELSERLVERLHDKEIVAYCRGRYCVLAHDAVRLLNANGLTMRASDGVLEWRVAGIPVQPGAA